MIDVALLGTGGMMPLPGRFLASMLYRVNGRMVLIDCGEGTQVSLRLLGWGFKRIDVICFTHFHGDHISGLPGLFLTMANAERTEPVYLFGPPGLENVVKSLCVIAPDLPFELVFTQWENREEEFTIFEEEMLTLRALPVYHRSACFAYCLNLKRRGKFDIDLAKKHNVPIKLWGLLQRQVGEIIVHEGRTFFSEMILGPERKGLKIVYCTDSRPVPALVRFASGADLFICEGLYGAYDKQEKAAAHRHMTFKEAAEIAAKAKVEELWLTHFSPAMPDPHNYLSAATDIFPNSVIGKDRMTKTLSYGGE